MTTAYTASPLDLMVIGTSILEMVVHIRSRTNLAGHFELAVQYNQDAMKLAPGNDKAMTNLGITLITSGDAEAALPLFEKAVELAPNNAEFHTNLGQALIVLRRKEAATRHFHRALELDPRCDRARYNLEQSKNL